MSCNWTETEKVIKEGGDMVLAIFASAADQECPACDYYDMVMSTVQDLNPEAPLGALSLDLADPSCREVLEHLGVSEYPTVIAFKSGKEHKRLSPVLDPDKDVAALEGLLADLKVVPESPSDSKGS